MATATKSCHFLDQSSSDDKQILYMNDKLGSDSPSCSSRFFAEFEYDTQSSSAPLVSLEDLQRRFTGTGNRISSPEITALSAGESDVSSEVAHTVQGRVGSYPASQHLPIAHEFFGRRLGEYGSLGFNELPDIWGDLRLYSQEMAADAVLPPQKLGWNEGSTSCTTTGDPMTATISFEFDRPSGQRNGSCPIPTSAETLALEASDLECHRSSLQRENNHLPLPGATSLTSVDFNSTLVYHGSSRSSKSEDTAFPPESSHQPGRSTLSPPPKPATRQKSRFHSQSTARDRVQDASRVGHFRNVVDDPQVALGSRQHNFLQQGAGLNMSSSPDLQRHHQPGECSTGGELDPPALKQKSNEQSPRRYQRRRIVGGNAIKNEVRSGRTPLDHVERERQRRDLMTSKIAALDLLLPKSTKRDRVSIVFDAIQLLKRLQREIKDLQRKFHEAKLRRASLAPLATHRQPLDPVAITIPKSIDCNMRTTGHSFLNEVVIKRLGKHMKTIDILTQPIEGTSGQSRPPQGSSLQCLEGSRIRDKGTVFVEFDVHLDDNVRVQEEKLLKCRCRKDYLSTMMGLVNQCQLDVVSCNIVKLSNYFICVIGLKIRTTKKTTTAAQFALRLQSAVDVDITREAEKELLIVLTPEWLNGSEYVFKCRILRMSNVPKKQHGKKYEHIITSTSSFDFELEIEQVIPQVHCVD
ncbi:unnamed protein product [Calypogeia fissa]